MNLNEITLSKIKDTVTNTVLNNILDSQDLSEDEIKIKKAELAQKIQNNELVFSGDLQQDITDANKYNKTAFELYIDILTSFKYINSLDGVVNEHIEQNQTDISNLKANLNTANDEIDNYENTISSNGNPQYKIEGFRTSNSFNNNRNEYQERYGEHIPLSNTALYNSYEELVTLPYLRKENMISFENGVSLGDVSISKQLCSRLIKVRNGADAISNVIDTSVHKYWSETILTDEQIRVNFNKERPKDPKDLKDYYYGITHGALCEVEINFEAVSKVNEITIMPYGKYPIDIVAIRYKFSDDIEEDLKEVVFPNNPKEYLRNKTISSSISYRFEDINCKRIYIIFNQIHFTKTTFLMDCNEIFKNDLWFNATNKDNTKPNLKENILFKPMYNDKSSMDSTWKYINNLILRDREIDIKQILFGKDDVIKPVIKYEYNYGFYNISPDYVEFAETGVYVSNPISANGNIKSVSITTDESHPVVDDSYITDIEYYISSKNNPSWDEWYPICPINKDIIRSELLQVEYSTCKLRFPANEVITVKRDKIVMVQDYDYFLVHNSDGQIMAIDIPNYDFFVKYTVSYIPAENSRTIDLISDEKPIQEYSYETISGNNRTNYILKEHPYIDSSIKTSTDVKLVNKYTCETISQNAEQIVCVTDPYNPGESYKNFDKTSSKYQYYTDKNNIFFNQIIPEDFNIEVNYTHFASSIKIKAIFRRNTRDNGWVTPVLKKIKYSFVTAD